MVKREPRDHVTDCYSCIVNKKGVGKKNRHKISCPSIPSAIRCVPHCEELPVPVFTVFSSCEDSDHDEGEHEGCKNEVVSESESFSDDANRLSAPGPFRQTELNDLVRDLGLSKKVAEILASRLQVKHLLDDSAKVSYFRKRDQSFVIFFSEQKQFVHCRDIPGLLWQLGLDSYIPTEWRLFLDSSKQNLKCVLLRNGDLCGGIPLGHSVHLRETYDDIKEVINLVKYHEHNWILCVDLKLVSFLLGQQRVFTKYPCHLCMWNSRDREKHWTQKERPVRETLEAGMPNIG